ncbi:hypothetical protein R1sor_005798 [Riccia sorocarpa]|uniref:Uncharacterized protein n=1 Tax=Riccia sorocarpa TaxID=122646 RepID=A0ABD3HKV1_9MARC
MEHNGIPSGTTPNTGVHEMVKDSQVTGKKRAAISKKKRTDPQSESSVEPTFVDKTSETTTLSPRTKACNQPGVMGQRNAKRRTSRESEDSIKQCMLQFTQVVKEGNEKGAVQEDRRLELMAIQEDHKLDLMNQMIELKRMELELLREKQRGSSS